jgi:hypothetical protein
MSDPAPVAEEKKEDPPSSPKKVDKPDASPSKATGTTAKKDFNADDDDDSEEEKEPLTPKELFENMMKGVMEDDPEQVEEWLSIDPSIVNMRDEKTNWSADDWAANNGHLAAMRVLIRHGCLH